MTIRHSPSKYLHMTRERADVIRHQYFKLKLKQKEIGKIHGIGQNTVSRIVSGLSWAR